MYVYKKTNCHSKKHMNINKEDKAIDKT